MSKVPESARGIAATSPFWNLSEAAQARFRRGWWDAYDSKETQSSDEDYRLGFEESLVAHGRKPLARVVRVEFRKGSK